MKVLTVLKYLINFIFIAFIVSAIFLIAEPFYSQAYLDYSETERVLLLILFPLVHLSIIFMILFYLRKFVIHSDIGEPLDKSTRKYLKFSGIFCLIAALIRIPPVIGIINFYQVTGEFETSYITNHLIDISSLFYISLIGVFFIYLSKVLESSDLIRQENNLTI